MLNEFEKTEIAYRETIFERSNSKKIINSFYEIISSNIKEINEIYEIEKKQDNELTSINDILKNIKIESKSTNDEKQIKREDGFIVSRFQEGIGILGVIYDGNPYITIELLIKAINTGNAIIFCTCNKKYAITNLLVLYFKQALKINGYNEDLVQAINSENDYKEMYNHNNILKKLIVIGDKNLQNQVVSQSKVEVLASGYDCFDLYIEDVLDEELLKKILKIKNIKLNIYINSNVDNELIERLNIKNYTEIDNLNECIRDININSSGYSSSIFTRSGANANEFIRLIKSKNVFVNASPTLERTLDIKEKDLLKIKQIMYINK